MIEHMTAAQMAVKVGISERSIQRWIQEGRLQAKRIEDSSLYEVESTDLERLRLRGHREEESRLQAVERLVSELDRREEATILRHQEQLHQMEERMDALEQRLASRVASMPAPRTRSAQPAESVSTSSELPDGLISARSFANRHGIHENTLDKAIKSGRLPVITGRWKVGNSYVQKALDASGRTRFVEMYRSNLHFHQCSDPACPCHEQIGNPDKT